MKLLQIGAEDWSQGLELGDDIKWFYTSGDQLATYLEILRQAALEKELAKQEQAGPVVELPKISLTFDCLIVTSSIEEGVLDSLIPMIEAYTVFVDKDVVVSHQTPYGICRMKVVRPLPDRGSREQTIAFLAKNMFRGQYGAKLKIPEIDVNPQFTGTIQVEGNLGISFKGHFGEDYQNLFTFRYNLSSFPMSLELWPEYIKEGSCHIRFEVVAMTKYSLGDIREVIYLDESDLAEPYILENDEEVGFYFVSAQAKGEGKIKVGVTHWRYSREGLGRFMLGGERHADAKRQELFTYFNPGDLQPPLNVYFSGFRGAQGFEGFYMMKSLEAPFLLVADPRLEGGCFYSGTQELEDKLKGAIQSALDYLGFSHDQLILSGLSMGAFGALYYAADFNPHAVVVGKPFTNLGDTVANLKLKRPGEFETSSDMMRNIVGGSTQESIERFNQYFWNKFGQQSFGQTQFAIAYMEQDDYDGQAIERLVDYLSNADGHIFAKGYEGRHNDNSPAINRWFKTQYRKFLQNDFGRKF